MRTLSCSFTVGILGGQSYRWKELKLETIPDFKRGVPGSTIKSDLMGKFGKGKQISPVVLLVVTENMKELFNFLIYVGVKGRGQGLVYIKLALGFSHKFESKLGASVGDYVLWESSSSPDIIQIELSGFFCDDSFVTRGDNDGFTEAIYYNEHRVDIAGFGEVGDKVHSDGFPYPSRNRVRMQEYLST